MRIAQLAYPILLCFAFLCCGQQGKSSDRNCTEFNNKAVESLNDYLYNGRSQSDLIKSKSYYDKAIDCDSLNFINYQGKLTVVNMLGQYDEALSLTDKLYELSGKTDVHMLISKALIFEKIGVIDSSRFYFERSFHSYDRQLEKNPPDSLRIIGDKLHLIAITQGKEVAIEKLRFYLAKYPNDSTLKLYEEIIMSFDRNTILPFN